MSYNLVDPTTGDLTRVAGSIDTSIIPSDASASNKLATTNSTLKTIQLSGSVDCNTLTEPGLYTASAGAVSAITNIPVEMGSAVQLDGGFSILVTKTNINNVYYGMQMFIPYGSDVPFIRKSYYLNGQYWTSWKRLCATTVEDVPITYISPADTTTFVNFANNSLCNYRVINGVCYVNLEGISIAYSGKMARTGVYLPKNAYYQGGTFLTGAGDTTPHAYVFILKDTGELCFDVKDANTLLYGSFSYPVAES